LRWTNVVLLVVLAGPVEAQPAPVALIDVPYISQSEALCGGAAAAMILRFWGQREVNAESFAHLVDRSAAGIRTGALVSSLRERGWNVTAVGGTAAILGGELTRARPVLTLIEDRPGAYHYVVVVGATDRTIFFHDPARAPFRAMARDEFERRWSAADRWMAIVVPGDGGRDAERPAVGSSESRSLPGGGPSVPSSPCDARVADGIASAQRQDLEGAERLLTAALPCPGAVRELAGVRLLQRRWPEVTELARAATTENPDDTYAWRLLATSRFVQRDPFGALDAWNRVGEPRVDLVSVSGLTRTRPRVVERLVALAPGQTLDGNALRLAQRRLGELPSATSTRLEYVPVAGGLAEIRASVVERPVVPRNRWSYLVLGAVAAARREIDFPVGAMTGGGERLSLEWRFWPARPRAAFRLEAPAVWGGVWGLDAAVERQPFDRVLPASRRKTAGLFASQWLGSRVRVSARGGVDRWDDAGTFAMADVGALLVSNGDRVAITVGVAGWHGDRSFASTTASIDVTSSRARRGAVLAFGGGARSATRATPADLWFGGDTGHVRSVPLRAHPLLDDGQLRTEQIGRALVFASGEAQYWKPVVAGVSLGVAAFADSVRLTRRLAPGSRMDVDAGLGLRVAVPTLPGIFRVDVAKGLRDGATALSVVYGVAR
jgi:hypothetical protein